ncbi:MAG TPA: aspartate-semialdehyde dehydrogenase [Thermoanaerobaculia bacterium]|jgi:aspartate-semialdehyde dehydrogenase|nr:aspartate-semialdehyde dehydrogenase [Thermoanaerobaculia bacterium]
MDTKGGKIEVGILGATGMVGQRFLQVLENHPWFTATWLGASDRSAGKRYREATAWQLEGQAPADAAERMVEECVPGRGPKLVFSSMSGSLAGEIEGAFAQAGHIVVSNSGHFRMHEDVPLLVPEINPDHLRLLPVQRRKRSWSGAVVTNPNCAVVTLVMALAPLKPFGLKRVITTTLQAVSGAGYPGVPSLDALGNVVPYIGGEEPKVESEMQKILGDLEGDAGTIRPLPFTVSATCTRVPTVDGHLVTASLEFTTKPELKDLLAALAGFRGLPQERGLPTAPRRPVHLMEAPDRPQTRKDAGLENGMAASVGRVRECPVFHYKLVALSHNTIRGAAGAAVLNAELMHSEGLLPTS